MGSLQIGVLHNIPIHNMLHVLLPYNHTFLSLVSFPPLRVLLEGHVLKNYIRGVKKHVTDREIGLLLVFTWILCAKKKCQVKYLKLLLL